MDKTAKRHLDAIECGAVTKTNVIGIRKILNHVARIERGWSGNRCNATPADAFALTEALRRREPLVIGELHDSGLKVLRSPRWHERFTDAQRAVINHPHVCFCLVGYWYIGRDEMHAVPVYRVGAEDGGTSFLFHNIPWQAAWAHGEESGPVVIDGVF